MALLVHGILKADSSNRPGTVKQGSLAALYSELTGDIDDLFYDPQKVASLAVSHNDLLVEWSQDHDVLPLRLGTVCVNENGVKVLLTQEKKRFTQGLAEIHDALEIGVRVTTDQSDSRVPATATDEPRSGRAYLKQRARAVSVRRDVTGQRNAFVGKLNALLCDVARDYRHLPINTLRDAKAETRIYDGAFLVTRAHVPTFFAAIDREAESAKGEGLTILRNGPWPAYHFLPDAV